MSLNILPFLKKFFTCRIHSSTNTVQLEALQNKEMRGATYLTFID